jgi:hypothetical protein
MASPASDEKTPSTTDNPAAVNTTSNLDPEKQTVTQVEDGNGGPAPAYFLVTPEMERRVVRKLDMRLVPLVMGLCMECCTAWGAAC